MGDGKRDHRCSLVPICTDWEFDRCGSCVWVGLFEGLRQSRRQDDAGDEQSSGESDGETHDKIRQADETGD